MAEHCSCMRDHDTQPDACGNCRFAACPCCTYPGEVECRRYAPDVGDSMTRHQWPNVRRSDWCGDYERRPGPPAPRAAFSPTLFLAVLSLLLGLLFAWVR